MDDVDEQLRSWGDEVMRGAEPAVTVAEVLAGRSGERAAPTAWFGVSQPSRRGRWAMGAAAAVALICAALFMVDRTRNEGELVRAGEPVTTSPVDAPAVAPPDSSGPDAGPVRFEVLAMGPALMNGMGSVHSAGVTSFQADEHLAAMWADAGRPPPVPEVDFGNRFVLSITIPDDACPPELTRFDRRERPVEGSADVVIEPIFTEPPGGCVQPLIPKTYIVAIDWESVGDDFWLFLPGQPTYGYDGSHHRFIRDRAAGSSVGPTEPDRSGSRAVIRAAIQAGLASEVRGVAIGDGPGPLGTPGAMGIAIDLPHSAVSLLSWASITAAQPEDPRRGLTEPTTVGTDAGGVVWIGMLPHTGAVLRFDCDGTRYQIEAGTGPSILLAVVDGLSAQLGCSPPGSAAPTECLGDSLDPVACAEE